MTRLGPPLRMHFVKLVCLTNLASTHVVNFAGMMLVMALFLALMTCQPSKAMATLTPSLLMASPPTQSLPTLSMCTPMQLSLLQCWENGTDSNSMPFDMEPTNTELTDTNTTQQTTLPPYQTTLSQMTLQTTPALTPSQTMLQTTPMPHHMTPSQTTQQSTPDPTQTTPQTTPLLHHMALSQTTLQSTCALTQTTPQTTPTPCHTAMSQTTQQNTSAQTQTTLQTTPMRHRIKQFQTTLLLLSDNVCSLIDMVTYTSCRKIIIWMCLIHTGSIKPQVNTRLKGG